MTPVVVDLNEFRSHGAKVYAGRARGAACRKAAALDEADAAARHVEVRVPEDVYGLTTGFLLAMFGTSIRHHGETEFRRLYRFTGWRQEPLEEALDDICRYALNRRSPL